MPHTPRLTAAREEARETWPFLGVVTLVLAVGYVSAVRSIDSLQEAPRLSLFTTLMLLTAVLFWLAPIFVGSGRRLVAALLLQAGAVFWIGLMTPQHWLVLGIFPAVAGMAIAAYWPDLRKSLVAALLCFGLLALNLAIGKGFDELKILIPFLVFALVFVFVYVVLFVRQVELRKQTQALLQDLEAAHEQLRAYAARVEELTLSQERERMGRELHDTLAQGLAGLIMQLEAVDCHLEAGNGQRAREVLQQAMRRSRSAHHEARRAIQALRASVLEDEDLIEALRREADQLTANTGISCRYTASITDPKLSPEQSQDVLRIVQESLSNAARHARASKVTLGLEEADGLIRVTVEDDGIGFDPGQRSSGLGLVGMQERAARLGGELRVMSSAGGGTRVELEMRRGKG
jgi:NarL family two-component system sensor histidine kinase YdfH